MNSLADDVQRAKSMLPMPRLLEAIGDGAHAKNNTRSPFRDGDNGTCFGIFEKDGKWFFRDMVSGVSGDEVHYLMERYGEDRAAAMRRYADLAGIRRDDFEPSALAAPPPKAPSVKKPENPGPNKSVPPIDWEKAVNDFIGCAGEVANLRGYSVPFVQWLRDQKAIGLVDGQIAFPVTIGGKVVSAHCKARTPTGEKQRWDYVPPLSAMGERLTSYVLGDVSTAKEIWYFESQWDGLAIADRLGWHEGKVTDTAIVCTRGTSFTPVDGEIPENALIVAFPQNDPPSKDKTKKPPAEEWMERVATAYADHSVSRVSIPKEHKDHNDWTRTGVNEADVRATIALAPEMGLEGVSVILVDDLMAFNPKEDPNSLLGDRWICKGGSSIWVGQSGLGKSSMMMQAACLWSLGRPFFGIKPRHVKDGPIGLKSLIIQAENDEGDLAEMFQGVVNALVSRHPEIQRKYFVEVLGKQVIFIRDTIHTSEAFAKVAAKLVRKYRPDLVWGDPLLSYVGDDLSQQKVASQFLRNYLNPVAFDSGIAWMMMHHTGKPSTDAKSKQTWKSQDYSYAGIGSSEITNWARAINVLGTTAHDGVFKLMMTKRGPRAGLLNLDNERVTSIHLSHAEYPDIYWNQVEEPAEEPKEGRTGRYAQKHTMDDILTQMSAISPIKATDLQKQCQTECGISAKTFYRLWKELKSAGRIQLTSAGLEAGWVRAA